MTGRGRRAVLPPADHRTEPLLAPDGVVVRVVNNAGYTKAFDFAELPVAEPMQRSLATVFAARAPGWTSHATAQGYWVALNAFARFVAELDQPPKDLGDLTTAQLKRWRARHIATNTGKSVLRQVRPLLTPDPRLASGLVADELARRIPSPRPYEKSYDKQERERVVLAAQRQFRSALLRIRENTRLLESWRAGELAEGSREWKIGQILDHLARTGEVPTTITARGHHCVKNRVLLGGSGAEATWGRLFLSRSELTALAVLLTDRFGWNLSVYDCLPAPTRAPSVGETASVTYQLQIEKRRKGRGHWFSTENITDCGADSPGRLITQALEATAHGRALAARLDPGIGLLMVARMHYPTRRHQHTERPRPVGPLALGVGHGDAQWWAQRHGLDGAPFRRTRRTTVTREGRPLQHSPGTHQSVYVLPDGQVQRASQSVFEAGAREALDQARAVVFAGHVAGAQDPAHQQTVTADCADETSSPWPGPEGGCAADFLLCLACPNARVHPGHHPRLAHLHQVLQSLRSPLPDGTWQERWSEHALRLDDLRDKVGPTAWTAALARVDDADRTLVHLLVKGELTP
ncbi:hypothetical protein [Streptomyces sp. Ru72]|uniref:hypothetical protein n=1 Tax=Streptomyces sp. Ru72 TaxID=2080747 RepID=UPI000CDE3E17|nr:hypothetical protein [Streptomyces sp. Ru72]POX50631.1 hypothetical protein C3488_14000 [Streptomyces sp. Ru72]